jgi:hypothetical protein
MKTGLFSIPIFLFAVSVNAEEVKGVDYCHDAKINQDWDKQIAQYPNDAIILHLAGLREGLCQMIDRGQITHEQGTDLWEDVRQRSIVERGKEEEKKAHNFTL